MTSPHSEGPELCSIIQHAIRSDAKEFLEPTLTLCRAINELCVFRRVEMKEKIPFPEGGKVYRGGLLPFAFHDFYKEIGRKYRIPGYLPTSFDQKVTEGFRKVGDCTFISAVLYSREALPHPVPNMFFFLSLLLFLFWC